MILKTAILSKIIELAIDTLFSNIIKNLSKMKKLNIGDKFSKIEVTNDRGVTTYIKCEITGYSTKYCLKFKYDSKKYDPSSEHSNLIYIRSPYIKIKDSRASYKFYS